MGESATAIAIVGIVVIAGVSGLVACVWLWAWRGRKSVDGEDAYRRLAEDAGNAQRRMAFEIGQIAEDVSEMRLRMVELERMLKEVG